MSVLICFLGVPIGFNVVSMATHKVLECIPTSKGKAEIPQMMFRWQAASCEENGESGILWHSPLMEPAAAAQRERQQWFGIWVRSCTQIAAETRTSREGPRPGGQGAASCVTGSLSHSELRLINHQGCLKGRGLDVYVHQSCRTRLPLHWSEVGDNTWNTSSVLQDFFR